MSAVLQAPAAEVSGGRLEALQLMAEALTAQQKSGDSARRALLAACGTPNAVPYVAVLLDAGCGTAVPEDPVPAPLQMETPLLAALNRGCLDVAELLFAKDKTASINATLPSGKAALHLAAERGDARLVASLLSARAQLDAVTSSGRAALHLAVEHGHVQAVQVLCQHDDTRLHHLLQPTPNGASPVCLAERRGKPSLILPMLRCYHRHLRERYLAGKLGDAGDKVSHPGLTALCIQHRDLLFNTPEADTGCMKGMPQTAKIAALTLLPEPVVAEEDSKSSRYKRVLDQPLEGRGRLKAQLEDGKPNPRTRAASADGPKSPAMRRVPRRPWGSALVKPRRGPKSAPAAANEAGGGTSCPSSQALLRRPPRPDADAPRSEAARAGAAAAMAADDAMQDLLQGFLSESEDTHEPRSQPARISGDGGMYSSESEPDE